MKSHNRFTAGLFFVGVLCVVGVASAQDRSRFSLELELGPVWQSKNTVQIPNTDAGTRFSLEELVGSGPWASGRLYFNWNISRRHSLRVLAAPLSYTESEAFDVSEFKSE